VEAVILAGGRGTRLGTRLQGIPKPMVLIGSQPFLEILLDRLLAGGARRIILSVGHLHSVIKAHFGSDYRGMNIDYVTEDEPLGTGGAIRQAIAHAVEPDILVLNGDTFLDMRYRDLLQAHTGGGAELTIAVVEQQDMARFGGLVIEANRIVSFTEKGQSGRGWINGGVYAVKSNLAWPSHLPERFSFETDFLMPELARLRPAAFECSGYFLDIGVPEDLDRAQYELVS
jgi:D-glycero-alpha-D-manno-heptose 1-phosphate guanylyltransferase